MKPAQFEIDEQTGEIIGHSSLGHLIAAKRQGKLDELTETDLVKVVQAVHDMDAEAAMFEGYLDSVRKTIEPRLAALEKRKEQVLAMFGELVAKATLAHPDDKGGKTKTTPFGRVSVRQVAGRLVIVDEAKAIDDARDYDPTLLKTVYKLDKRGFIERHKDDKDLADVGIERRPDSVSTTIDTGIKKAKIGEADND